MKPLRSLSFLLLAGTCAGVFFSLWSFPSLRLGTGVGSISERIWQFISVSHPEVPILAANLLLFGVWWLSSWIYSRFSGESLKRALRLDAYTYLPLCVLAVPLLQFYPPLTHAVEGFLLLSPRISGYLLLLLAVLAICYLKAENFSRGRWAAGRCLPIALSKQHLAWKTKFLVFVISLILYSLVGFRVSKQIGLSGDEPHYLLITHSLAYDHDLDMLNNYRQQDYRAFYDGYLHAHVSIGRDGARYPGHPVGLALLLLPAYMLGGLQASILLVNVLAALLAVQLHTVAFTFTQRRWLALLLWGITSFTSPLLLYSSQLYPEIPSALLLLTAYRIIYSSASDPSGRQSIFRTILLGGALAFLPWLHQRMILPAVALLLYHLFNVAKQYIPFLGGVRAGFMKKNLYPILLPIAFLLISGSVMAGFYGVLYGNPLPNAPYTSVGMSSVFSSSVLFKQGLPGHLLDQEAGLLIYSPYYVFFIAGFFLLLKRCPVRAFWLLALILSIYLPCAGFEQTWRGGWSPASRFMAVLAPFFLIPLSLGVAQTERMVYHYVFVFLTAVSFYWSYLLLRYPAFALMRGIGLNHFFERTSYIDLTRYFPAFPADSTRKIAVMGMWFAIIAVFSFFLYHSAENAAENVRRTFKSASVNKNVFSLEQKTVRGVISVFALYGLIFLVFAAFAMISAETETRSSNPQLDNNRRLWALLSDFPSYALTVEENKQSSLFEQETFRFEYIQREKRGIVGHAGERFIVTGPGDPFPQGRYTAYFVLQVENNSSNADAVTIEVVANRGKHLFGRKSIRGIDFSTPGVYQLFPLVFELRQPVEDLETRVYFYNRVNVNVRKIYIEPDLAEFYYDAGMSALKDRRYAEARQLFRRAADISDHIQALYQIARLEQQSGNWEHSRGILQQILKQDPNFAEAYYRLGLAFQQSRHPEQAQKHLEQAALLLPTHLETWKALQKLYRQLNMPKQEQQAVETLETLYHPDYPYSINFGDELMFLGYSIQNPAPGKLHLEYYWKALAPMKKSYFVFVHFRKFYRTAFQQDYVPQTEDAITKERQSYPTDQWKIGELIKEEYELTVPTGTFTMTLGVWDPIHTKQRLPVLDSSKAFSFWKKDKIFLQRIRIK